MDPTPFENELTLQSHQSDGTVDEFHQRYEAAVESVTADVGDSHPLWVDGEPIETDEQFSVVSPGNTDLEIGTFAAADTSQVDRAVEAATAAFDDWRATDWDRRAEIFRAAADLLGERKFEFAATLTLENGKNRTEAMAEVDEAVDFLRFYARELEASDGYRFDTGEPTPGEHCRNLLRPYGVFGVVAPFNFPLAILVGMTTGAVITGNTAVVKPASETPLIAHRFLSLLTEAGLPDGVVNLVTGGGSTVGQPLVEHEHVAGVAFTGSREVGLGIERTFREDGKRGPVIAELGGKNPVIVSNEADLDAAVSGITMGAFSFSGQKCSATSRVYAHEDVFDVLVDRIVDEARSIPIVPPEEEDAVLSPLIDEAAVERYLDACERARADGTVRTGGEVVSMPDLPPGRYVRPTVVTDLPHDHDLAREELFVPFVTIHPVADLDEAIRKANDSDYGLCAGLFSEDEGEIRSWFDRIESGMCYVNRHQSATTGAIVQSQPFGGWKFSGTTGKFAGGYWYLPQFMREQSRTVVGDIGRNSHS